jgi:host cell surface-exposed lipoprotein
MIKRIALLTTAAVVALGLTACSDLGTSAPKTDPNNTASAPSAPTAGCFAPTAAPPVPADGNTVTWNKQLCSWVEDAKAAPAAAPTTEAAPTTSEAPQFPPQVEQARDAAQSYLGFKGFSRTGLIQQLSSSAGDGYPKDVATQAVDSLNLDYNAQAVKSAESYLDFTSFSCSGLISQLDSSAGDGYTKAQATYGAHQTKACK